MYNITIIFSVHLDVDNHNSTELLNIIEKENPEIIFEEFDISRNEDEYYKNGHYKYQEQCSVETTAIMKYLEKYKVIHIPVDTYEVTYFPTEMYRKISLANEEYDKLFKENLVKSLQQGYSYINSIESNELFLKMHIIEEEVLKNLNDKLLSDEYEKWKWITNNRDKEMLNNIYNFSKKNKFNNAIFIIGAEHRISIFNKIKDFNKNEKLKINWKSWRIA